MDGNEQLYRPATAVSIAAFCIGVIVCWSADTVIAQTPQPLGSWISARPIELATLPSNPTATLVKPHARLIAADKSPFVATLSVATVNAESTDVASVPNDNAPSAAATSAAVRDQWNPRGQTAESLGDTVRSVDEALQARGTVSFRKTPISEVVFLLSELWHINIVAGENVSGEVSGTFHDAPLSEVLAAVLTSSGYSYRTTGSSLVVLPADQIGINDPSFVSDTLVLPTSLRDDASTLEAAQMLLSERGQLKKIGTDLVLVIDQPDRIERVRNLFQSLSPSAAGQNSASAVTPTVTSAGAPIAMLAGISYFSPQYTEAVELAEPLRVALGDQVIVAVYPQENRIMVKGTPQNLQLAAEIIDQLDKPRQQVRITAMIYDVGLTELERLGVNWSRDVRGLANGRNEFLPNVTESVNSFTAAASDLTTSGVTSVGIRTITNSLEASVFLEALDTSSEAKLLADPSITVGDRRQASIKIVREIPIVGANPVNNSNAVFTQTEFKEAGVILNVMPRISRDGTIEMNVQPEYSVVAEITATGPVIDSRTAETYVRVANGQIFVLGGLRQKSIIESKRGIPYLRDIKYIGVLFRSHNSEVRESELIVFLKPEIITPCYAGSGREQVAARVATNQLDAIPYASECPQTECCKDSYCPNHHPRPRINAGSIGLPLIGEDGLYMQNPTFPTEVYEGQYSSPDQLGEVVYPITSGRPTPMQQPATAPSTGELPASASQGFPMLHIESRPE